MKNLFLIKKKLTHKMINCLKVLTENNNEKIQLISDIRVNKLSYYMIPVRKCNYNILAIYLKEVKSITS